MAPDVIPMLETSAEAAGLAGCPGFDFSLPAAAERVLRLNDNGGYTVPSRSTYPHQWNWDSALAALGWAELDCDRA
jgi:hypothetical protein